MTQITDKTRCVILQGNYKCYLTPEQSELLERDILLGKQAVKIDEYFFNSRAVMFILPAADIERDDRVKRGDWKCVYDEWHIRGQECGHGIAQHYSIG